MMKFPASILIFCHACALTTAASHSAAKQILPCASPTASKPKGVITADFAANGEPVAAFNLLANAIRRAEGVWTYGVKTVPVRNEAHARAVCINTIRHAWRDWDRTGDFLDFLAQRYAPAGAKNDPHRLNRNWAKNVRFYLRKQEAAL